MDLERWDWFERVFVWLVLAEAGYQLYCARRGHKSREDYAHELEAGAW